MRHRALSLGAANLPAMVSQLVSDSASQGTTTYQKFGTKTESLWTGRCKDGRISAPKIKLEMGYRTLVYHGNQALPRQKKVIPGQLTNDILPNKDSCRFDPTFGCAFPCKEKGSPERNARETSISEAKSSGNMGYIARTGPNRLCFSRYRMCPTFSPHPSGAWWRGKVCFGPLCRSHGNRPLRPHCFWYLGGQVCSQPTLPKKADSQ